ncbi:MAG: hypothetical protein FWH22_10460, partial [Fibromonadales bacterium]|nr:hypothetical protein [Fibromonadales bacterium]
MTATQLTAKSGISLIAVLMFMLAATTASIVVFRMIGSENLASGARLKMSESEAAANSGLEAVQAWLENRAPDAGVLLSDFLSNANLSGGQPKPMLIGNNILGSVGGNRGQNYQVYLIGADAGNNNIFKLKFLSIGKARDNSQSRQVGIFGVQGLYRLRVPNQICRGPFDQSFFGVAGELTDGTEFSSAIINSDVSGNMPRITENLIVTGNATFQGGTTAACSENNQGDLYIAGNLKPNGNLRVCGNAYAGSIEFDSGADGTFEKNLYIENGGTVEKGFLVNGNLTVNNGTYRVSTDADNKIDGDFAMLSNSAKLELGGNGSFTVEGTT